MAFLVKMTNGAGIKKESLSFGKIHLNLKLCLFCFLVTDRIGLRKFDPKAGLSVITIRMAFSDKCLLKDNRGNFLVCLHKTLELALLP
jgi:hypothetical protein